MSKNKGTACVTTGWTSQRWRRDVITARQGKYMPSDAARERWRGRNKQTRTMTGYLQQSKKLWRLHTLDFVQGEVSISQNMIREDPTDTQHFSTIYLCFCSLSALTRPWP